MEAWALTAFRVLLLGVLEVGPCWKRAQGIITPTNRKPVTPNPKPETPKPQPQTLNEAVQRESDRTLAARTVNCDRRALQVGGCSS